AGVRSNVAFLARLCRAEEFRQGRVDTGFIDRNLAALGGVPHDRDSAGAALGVAHLLGAAMAGGATLADDDAAEFDSPWSAPDGFQLGDTRSLAVPVVVDGESVSATVVYAKDGPRVTVEGA